MSNDNSVQNEGIAEVDAHHIVATALPHMATIATAAADGRFDHTERPAVREAADQLVATFLALSSAGAAA